MSLLEDLKKIDEIEEVIVTAPKKEKPIIQQAVQTVLELLLLELL